MTYNRLSQKQHYLVIIFVGSLVKRGNRTRALRFFENFLSDIEFAYQVDPLILLESVIEDIRPKIFLIPKKIAGSTIRIPGPISTKRSLSIAVRWFLSSVSKRSGEPFNQLIVHEFIDLYNNAFNGVRAKRDEYHKLALVNRPFLRFNRF
jgi:ribosomal protein S7